MFERGGEEERERGREGETEGGRKGEHKKLIFLLTFRIFI
jgi:hypothetical protein